MSQNADAIAAITASCATISALDFLDPGIFTNAIISKPEVTSLIRDALPPELSLYRISRSGPRGTRFGGSADEDRHAELRPERIDGKSIYIDGPNSEDQAPAVRVPELAMDVPHQAVDELSSPTKKRIASLYKLIPASVIESEDVNEICRAVAAVVEQYPTINNGSSVQARLAELQREYGELVLETTELEQKVSDQRVQLEIYTDSINGLPRRGVSDSDTDIDELIAEEEREIAGLEAELTERQR